jgi:DnaJ-class molecular chaperone
MDKNKDYYSILGVSSDSDDKIIKKAYYKLSFEYHPDRNKEVDITKFNSITEAYDILCSEVREEYDKKSKFGRFYNEYYELFDVNVEYDYNQQKTHFETFKKNEVNNIQIEVDESFDGSIEYERWVKCKSCDGTGKDLSSKIAIKDKNGNIIKYFEADDGCDFCDGVGKIGEHDCNFCQGKGKVGLTFCSKCNGEKRILGKQKLTGIKITGDEIKVESMGHHSKNEVGKVGYLLIRKKL